MIDITASVAAWVHSVKARDGLLTVFLRHISASLTIQESADEHLRAGVLKMLGSLAPDHSAHGRMHAAADDGVLDPIKALLTSVSLSIPVFENTMALSPWQGIFLIEHRRRLAPRTIALCFVGSHH